MTLHIGSTRSCPFPVPSVLYLVLPENLGPVYVSSTHLEWGEGRNSLLEEQVLRVKGESQDYAPDEEYPVEYDSTIHQVD